MNPEPSIPQNPLREEGIPPLEIPVEIKDDLFYADFGKSLNFLLHKRPSSEYNSNPLKKGSLRKHPYSHVGHWEELKDGMSSDVIEVEPSHLEAIPVLSPSMLTTDTSFEPILDPDDPPDVLFPESHDDSRNPLRRPKYRSHGGHKEDQKEQQ